MTRLSLPASPEPQGALPQAAAVVGGLHHQHRPSRAKLAGCARDLLVSTVNGFHPSGAQKLSKAFQEYRVCGGLHRCGHVPLPSSVITP